MLYFVLTVFGLGFGRVYTYSKYAYTYNWVAYACPLYVHAYLCPKTLIQLFMCLFLYFFCLICLSCSLFPYVYVSVSLIVCLIILNMLC